MGRHFVWGHREADVERIAVCSPETRKASHGTTL